jgi:phosphoribosylformylglycinamidine (FGAM) synthase-like enzyme
VALTKISFQSKLGILINRLPSGKRLDEIFFGETASSALVGFKPENKEIISSSLQKQNLDFIELGEMIADYQIKIPDNNLSLKINSLEKDWLVGLKQVFE